MSLPVPASGLPCKAALLAVFGRWSYSTKLEHASADNRAAQEDELTVLEAIYGNDLVVQSPCACEVWCMIALVAAGWYFCRQ